MARKAAAGTGNIRKKTVTRNGKQYTYWEGRYTVGYDPGTGKQIQRSITGKTQKEVAQKLKEVTHDIDEGTYIAPNKTTVGKWLDTWVDTYLTNAKASTVNTYKTHIRLYLKPSLGAIKLSELQPHTIQTFINGMQLSPRTVSISYKVLHQALEKAVSLDFLVKNPSAVCEVPRAKQEEIHPIEVPDFIEAIKGNRFETLFKVTLFTGMRMGEVLGLMWSSVDFEAGVIRVDKQLCMEKRQYVFRTPKSGKPRTVTPAGWVFDLLKKHRAVQAELRLKAGPLWEDSGLVFSNDIGQHLALSTVRGNFKRCAIAMGDPKARFHDLRHTYAVSSILAGDDIKTIQTNLGHASAGFTLDVYGHVTEQMRKKSAERMDTYIKQTLGL